MKRSYGINARAIAAFKPCPGDIVANITVGNIGHTNGKDTSTAPSSGAGAGSCITDYLGSGYADLPHPIDSSTVASAAISFADSFSSYDIIADDTPDHRQHTAGIDTTAVTAITAKPWPPRITGEATISAMTSCVGDHCG
ncbi:MAG: hypothetical protein KC418_23770 [Anaerolineales bacterium]|nr:hypothetical protein [Anaerolineae bacterium]MCA9941687.1 hypothetical protein [Anaerolineales bacterium]MCB0252905.1 hypothetical protein [Anaerolineae bacterium]